MLARRCPHDDATRRISVVFLSVPLLMRSDLISAG